MAVICRHAPAGIDGQAAELARSATVVQLRRVLGSYSFEEPKPAEAQAEQVPEERRWVSFGHDDQGSWTLSARLPADEGALVERALGGAGGAVPGGRARVRSPSRPLRRELGRRPGGGGRQAGPGAAPPHHDRPLVLLHVDTEAMEPPEAISTSAPG